MVSEDAAGNSLISSASGILPTAESVTANQPPPFVLPAHETLELVRHSVGLYSKLSEIFKIMGICLLILAIIKGVGYRPIGVSKEEWDTVSLLDQLTERAEALFPIFFPAFYLLMVQSSLLAKAATNVETYFTDPTVENKPDSLFPMGDGRYFIS